MLKTFVQSTRQGVAIKGYEFCLSESASLSGLAASRSVRILDEIADVVNPANPHSHWLLNEGYRSSFTVPLYERQEFIGFLFYDSLKPAAAGRGAPAQGSAPQHCCHPVAAPGQRRQYSCGHGSSDLRWYSNQGSGLPTPCKDWRLRSGLPAPATPGLVPRLLHQWRGRGAREDPCLELQKSDLIQQL
jgi:hypothetical protein